MTHPLQSRLLTATSSTFEELGFVFPETELEDHQADAALAWSARVAFRGPVCGTLEIRVSDDVAAELAANMLGLPDGVDPGVKRDALGEIANVICGNVVPALGRPEDVFDLDAPTVTGTPDGPLAGPPIGTAVHVQLGVESGRAELWLDVREPAAETVP